MTPKNIAIAILIVSLVTSCDFADNRKWEEAKKSKTVYKIDTIRKHIRAVLEDTTFVWVNTSYNNFPYKKYCENEVLATFDLRDSTVLQFIKEDSLAIARTLTKRFQEEGISVFIGQTIDRFELNVYLYTEKDLNPIGILFDLPIPNTGKLKTDKEWKSYEYLTKPKH